MPLCLGEEELGHCVCLYICRCRSQTEEKVSRGRPGCIYIPGCWSEPTNLTAPRLSLSCYIPASSVKGVKSVEMLGCTAETAPQTNIWGIVLVHYNDGLLHVVCSVWSWCCTRSNSAMRMVNDLQGKFAFVIDSHIPSVIISDCVGGVRAEVSIELTPGCKVQRGESDGQPNTPVRWGLLQHERAVWRRESMNHFKSFP